MRDQASECRRRVDELLWLQRTVRPDISFPLHVHGCRGNYCILRVRKCRAALVGDVEIETERGERGLSELLETIMASR